VINRRSDEDVEGVEKAIASLPKARPYVIRDRTITCLAPSLFNTVKRLSKSARMSVFTIDNYHHRQIMARSLIRTGFLLPDDNYHG